MDIHGEGCSNWTPVDAVDSVPTASCGKKGPWRVSQKMMRSHNQNCLIYSSEFVGVVAVAASVAAAGLFAVVVAVVAVVSVSLAGFCPPAHRPAGLGKPLVLFLDKADLNHPLTRQRPRVRSDQEPMRQSSPRGESSSAAHRSAAASSISWQLTGPVETLPLGPSTAFGPPRPKFLWTVCGDDRDPRSARRHWHWCFRGCQYSCH